MKHAAAVFVFIAWPEFAADVPLPAFRIEVDGDGCRAYIRNVHSSPLSAYWLEQVGYPGTRWRSWSDALVGRSDAMGAGALAPGIEKNFWFKNQTVCSSPDYVKMLAAVYEDGTSAGSAEKVKHVIDTRRQKLIDTRAALAELQKTERFLATSKFALE